MISFGTVSNGTVSDGTGSDGALAFGAMLCPSVFWPGSEVAVKAGTLGGSKFSTLGCSARTGTTDGHRVVPEVVMGFEGRVSKC